MNLHKSSFSKWGNMILCVLAAFIWGIAFVAQSTGGELVGPYTFNCFRCFMGGLVLIPVILIMNRFHKAKAKQNATFEIDENTTTAPDSTTIATQNLDSTTIATQNLDSTTTATQIVDSKSSTAQLDSKKNRKNLLLGGVLCGLLLCVASNLQQVALAMGAPAGKAGFLTACYILLVPVLGLFLKKKCGWNVWLGVMIAVVGLYLLCINGSFSLQRADILLLICAVVFSLHILVIDHFAPKANCVAMSCIQFFVCGTITAIPMFFVDMSHSFEGILSTLSPLATLDTWIPLLYTGILSSGVAYTLQIIGQKNTNPTVASLLFSLESVFSVLAGWVLLNQKLQSKELFGCVLIFGAIVLAQLPLNQAKFK